MKINFEIIQSHSTCHLRVLKTHTCSSHNSFLGAKIAYEVWKKQNLYNDQAKKDQRVKRAVDEWTKGYWEIDYKLAYKTLKNKKEAREEADSLKQFRYHGAAALAQETSNKYTGKRNARAISNLKKLVTRNAAKDLKFVTLTFENEIKTMEEVKKEFRNFSRRLDAYHGKECKYIYVPELGEKNNRLHLHAIIDMPFIRNDDFQKNIWKNGFTTIYGMSAKGKSKKYKNQYGEKRNQTEMIAFYITKYLAKEKKPIEGQNRAYYASKGWRSDCIKGVISPGGQVKFERYIESLKKRTRVRQSEPYIFPVGETTLTVQNYKISKIKAETMCEELRSLGIEARKSDFMRVSEEEKKAIAFLEFIKSINMDRRSTQEWAYLIADKLAEFGIEKNLDKIRQGLEHLTEIYHQESILPNPYYFLTVIQHRPENIYSLTLHQTYQAFCSMPRTKEINMMVS